MFAASFDWKSRCWPYDIKVGDPQRDGRPSQGTSAMIAAAIGKLSGCCTMRGEPRPEQLPNMPKGLLKVYARAITGLEGQLLTEKKVHSGTFGDNDPLTISHLTELSRGLAISPLVKKRAETVISQLPAAKARLDDLTAKDPADAGFLADMPDVPWCNGNAFIALRIVRAQEEDLGKADAVRNVSFRKFFEFPTS